MKLLFLLLPSTLAAGPPCQPPPPDLGGPWLCYPEVPPGSSVPDGTDCILSCGSTSSSHQCQGGEWSSDPSQVRCTRPGCPPLLGTDPTGQFTCFPTVAPNTTASPGTFCIYSCGGHAVDEITCQEDGHWTSDPDHISCFPTTTTTPTSTVTPTTWYPTTIAPPNLQAELLWAFYYLGTGIGVTGILVGDFDENGKSEFVLGSGSGFGGNTEISVVEFTDPGYSVVWQESFSSGRYNDPTISHIALINVDGTDCMAASVGGQVYIYNLKTREAVNKVDVGGIVRKTLSADINGDGENEVMFLSTDSDYCSGPCTFSLSLRDSNWTSIASFTFQTENSYLNIVFGSFTKVAANQMALSNGEVYEFIGSTDIQLVANFKMDLGRHLFKYDLEGDGIDEIICSKGGVSAYSAVDLGRIWNSKLDHAVDAMTVVDLDGDGRSDVVWGADQWGDIAALDILTGEEFWRTDNPEHGVTAIALGDFDQDGDIEIAWGAGYSTTGADFFFVCDVKSKQEEWKSIDLDPPFDGFDIHDPAEDGQYQITALSSGSNSGYDGGIVFGFDLETKDVIWQTETNDFRPSVSLTTGDVDNSVFREVISVSENNIHVLNGVTGALKYDVKLSYQYDIKSVITLDIDEDGQDEIVVGADSDVIFLNGDDGSQVQNTTSVGSGQIVGLSPWYGCNGSLEGVLALSSSYDMSELFLYSLETGHLKKVWHNDTVTVMAPVLEDLGASNRLYLGTKDGHLHVADCNFNPQKSVKLCKGAVSSLAVVSAVEVAYVCGEAGEWGVVNMLEERKEMVEEDMEVTRVGAYWVGGEVLFLTGGRVLKLYRAT